MDFSIVDILSMGASISTIFGLIIAIRTLQNYTHERKENLEYKIKKNFFDGIDWEILQEKSKIETSTNYSCSLHITNSNFHSFAGKIRILGPDGKNINHSENITMFNFVEVNGNEITIKIDQATELTKREISLEPLGTAILKHINPQLFEISFSENCIPNLPRTAYLMKILN